jgi:hypothetical protein
MRFQHSLLLGSLRGANVTTTFKGLLVSKTLIAKL